MARSGPAIWKEKDGQEKEMRCREKNDLLKLAVWGYNTVATALTWNSYCTLGNPDCTSGHLLQLYRAALLSYVEPAEVLVRDGLREL
jgi:hypothetical protein